MTDQVTNTGERQAPEKLMYQKPEVTEIELVAFDVLGGTCGSALTEPPCYTP
jgi:hypothetical protein